MGRPPTNPSKIKLKPGFYIEIRGIGAKTGIKIQRDTYDEIQVAIKKYETTYEVIYLGEMKNGEFHK